MESEDVQALEPGVDADSFITSLVQLVEKELRANQDKLGSRPMQALMTKRARDMVPQLPSWSADQRN
jgi:hypothetical protein